MGIIPEYLGLGGTALLFSEMEKSIKSRQFKHADIVQIGVENERMQRELEELGINFYKIHRVYLREFESKLLTATPGFDGKMGVKWISA